MNRFSFVIHFFCLVLLSACAVNPPSAPSTHSAVKPITPSSVPKLTDLVGKYRLFYGSEVSFDVVEDKGQLFMSLFGQKETLRKLSPTRFRLQNGDLLNFDYSATGKYDRFVTLNEGRPQLFILDETLQRNRTAITQQAVYTSQIQQALKPAAYAYSSFLSPSRGLVDYSVYLPPQWQRNSDKTYPLVFFLHGQTGWERSFPDSVPATQLNHG